MFLNHRDTMSIDSHRPADRAKNRTVDPSFIIQILKDPSIIFSTVVFGRGVFTRCRRCRSWSLAITFTWRPRFGISVAVLPISFMHMPLCRRRGMQTRVVLLKLGSVDQWEIVRQWWRRCGSVSGGAAKPSVDGLSSIVGATAGWLLDGDGLQQGVRGLCRRSNCNDYDFFVVILL
jgi:hypothetical protein